MQLLTFLGVFRLEVTDFTWKGNSVLEYQSPYVVEALLKFNNIKQVTVFLTPEAEQHENWLGLKKCVEKYENISINSINISSGETERDIWQIFEAVVNAVKPKSQVIFDITHAFRSIPFLAFLATAFLQKATDVKVDSVYYAAFKRDQPKTPIVDLTPALRLLDWLTATQQFINTGSSVDLGELLKTIQQDFNFNNLNDSKPPRLLESLGNSIQDISRSLELIRAMGILQDTANLQTIPAIQLSQEVGYFAKPFELLSAQIQQSYSQFALSSPEKVENSQLALQKHFLLLRWYVKNNMAAQAILLAREWIVSVRCQKKGMIYLNRDHRKKVEDEINDMNRRKKPNLSKSTARSPEDKLILIWSDLIKYRNDIAHAQMSFNSTEITKLQKYVTNELIQSLENLFPEFVV